MLSLSKYKKMLEEETQQCLTNEEAESICDAMYQFARLILEQWRRERMLNKQLQGNA